MRFVRRLLSILTLSAAPILGAIALGGGCASNAALVNMWRDPTYDEPAMHSLLVVSLRRNQTNRRLLEDAFGQELAKRGVDATPSYEHFPNAPPDTSQIADVVNQHGYDGALIVYRLRTETSENFVPGYATSEPVWRVSPWTGRYRTYWVEVMHPGYTETDVTVRHEVELWDMREGGRLIWTGVGEVVNPASSSDVTHDVAHNVVPELEKQGFIPKKR
jgi:hypothetical protein